MSLLKFLQSSNVEEVKASPKGRGGPRKQWNPAPALVAIRVWGDGSVFPSKAAVDKFDLEYRNAKIGKKLLPLKDGETEADQKTQRTYEFPNGTGNGFDVIDSRAWNQVKGEGAMLFAVPVPKDAGKVDLFNTVGYEEDGTPKSSVMDQGTVTFGQQVLIPALEEVYGIKLNRPEVPSTDTTLSIPAVTDGVDFVDLAIFSELGEGAEMFDITEKYSKPILHVPKRVTRGADRGKSDYIRRENVKVYGLAPAAMVIPGYKVEEPAKEEKDAEEEKEVLETGPSKTKENKPAKASA